MGIPCTLIPGDGIGPDITEATLRVLDAVCTAGGTAFEWDRQVAGVAAVKANKDPLPDETLESIKRTRLALKGPLETPIGEGFRSVNVALRKTFDLYANVRPAKDMIPGGRFDNVDIVLVRENTEGLYAGLEHYIKIGTDERAAAQSVALVTRVGSERVIRYAFEYAVKHERRRLTLVHKANILKYSQGLFRDIGQQVAREYEGRVAYDEQIIDAMAMKLVLYPEKFDMLVTTNMFGDILSDLTSGLVGGLGLAPGANIGEHAAHLRGGARNGAGHRGAGDRQSGSAHPRRLSHARACRRPNECPARARRARVRCARREDCHAGPGGQRQYRAIHRLHHWQAQAHSRRQVAPHGARCGSYKSATYTSGRRHVRSSSLRWNASWPASDSM